MEAQAPDQVAYGIGQYAFMSILFMAMFATAFSAALLGLGEGQGNVTDVFSPISEGRIRSARVSATLDGAEGRNPFNMRAHMGYASPGLSASLLGLANGKTARGEFIQVHVECLSPYLLLQMKCRPRCLSFTLATFSVERQCHRGGYT